MSYEQDLQNLLSVGVPYDEAHRIAWANKFGDYAEVNTGGAPENMAWMRDEYAEVNTGGGVPYPGGTGPTEYTGAMTMSGNAGYWLDPEIPEIMAQREQVTTDPGSDPETAPTGGGDTSPSDGGGGTTTTTTSTPSMPEPRSILSSPTLKWYYDTSTGYYYASYGLPGSDRELVFEATQEDMVGLFPNGNFPPTTSVTNLRVLLEQPNITYGGALYDMEGTGNFEDLYNRTIALSLDEGRLPDWAVQSPEVLDLLFVAVSEEKSDEWLLNQIATTAAFETRFPGLNALRAELGGSVEDSVAAFLELERGVMTLEERFGGTRSSITPDIVGQLLTGGYNLSDIELSYQTFERYENNREALTAFNEILVANGAAALTEDEMFEFLEGNAPMEIYDLYEAASFREAATAEGLGAGLDPFYALELAQDTLGMVSLSDIRKDLQQAARQALRMRADIDLERYGVGLEDLVDLSLGVTPRSGATLGQLTENLSRLQSEAQAHMKDRTRPFFGFTPTGRPQTVSLSERAVR